MKNVKIGRCIDIGLERCSVAAASVVEGYSHCSNKGVKSVDVYKTFARIFRYNGAEAREGGGPAPALKAPEPHRASSVLGRNPINHFNIF